MFPQNVGFRVWYRLQNRLMTTGDIALGRRRERNKPDFSISWTSVIKSSDFVRTTINRALSANLFTEKDPGRHPIGPTYC